MLPKLAEELEKRLGLRFVPSAMPDKSPTGLDIINLDNPNAVELERGLPASPWEVRMLKVLAEVWEENEELRRKERRRVLRARIERSKGSLGEEEERS